MNVPAENEPQSLTHVTFRFRKDTFQICLNSVPFQVFSVTVLPLLLHSSPVLLGSQLATFSRVDANFSCTHLRTLRDTYLAITKFLRSLLTLTSHLAILVHLWNGLLKLLVEGKRARAAIHSKTP